MDNSFDGFEQNRKFIDRYESRDLFQGMKALAGRVPCWDQSKQFEDLVNFSRSKVERYQSWFRYREGYSRLLVRRLLEQYKIDSSKYFVADPMVGSGTTSIECCSKGIDVLSMDVNPISQIMVSLKTKRPSKLLLDQTCIFAADMDFQKDSKTPKYDQPFYEYFSPMNFAALIKIKDQINKVVVDEMKEILFGAWLMIVEDCSNRKRDGNGLLTRESLVSDVGQAFLNKLDQIISDYRHFPLESKSMVSHRVETAKGLKAQSDLFAMRTGKRLGMVIFSPPYANSFDYIESYKLELVLGEFSTYESLDDVRKKAIRNYRISKNASQSSQYKLVEDLAKEIESAIPEKESRTGKRDSRSRLVPNMLRSYFEDMSDVLKNIFSALDAGGRCLIVIDQSAYLGKVVPTDYIFAHIAEEIGFLVGGITVCRKATTSPQQLRDYPYLKESLKETIVELIKPATA